MIIALYSVNAEANHKPSTIAVSRLRVASAGATSGDGRRNEPPSASGASAIGTSAIHGNMP